MIQSLNKIAVISANIGSFDTEYPWVEQSIPSDFYIFNNSNFPVRSKAMTPRLQARIPKMFGWQMVPNYNIYIWFDSSLAVSSKDMVRWFIEKLGDNDAVFLKHPCRQSIKEEVDFIKQKTLENNYYIVSRYSNELIDEELKEIREDKNFIDNTLIASTTFAYRNNSKTQAMMKEWWYHTSRYHIVDQLGLPYAIYKTDCKVNIIEDSYLHLDHFKHMRRAYKKRIMKKKE